MTEEFQRIAQSARRSSALVHRGIAYLSGQVPTDREVDISGQTQQVLAKIDGLLAEAGTSKARVLTAQIWLKTMDDFAAMNAVWDAWVAPGQTPTRCCGKVELNDPKVLVEIVVTASVPESP
jgi:enamine deaminase RidA (YjgF/YER057c/UK114 family)